MPGGGEVPRTLSTPFRNVGRRNLPPLRGSAAAHLTKKKDPPGGVGQKNTSQIIYPPHQMSGNGRRFAHAKYEAIWCIGSIGEQ